MVCDDVVHRQEEFHVTFLRSLQDLVCEVEFVIFHTRLPHRLTLSFQKCVRHRSADDERINFGQKALNDGNFVAHFSAAKNRNERLLRM